MQKGDGTYGGDGSALESGGPAWGAAPLFLTVWGGASCLTS